MNSMRFECIAVIICLSFFFFFNSPSPSHAAATNSPSKLVKDVCHQTNNKTFCMQALESDPRTASAKDLVSLTRIALELAIHNATNTQAFITHKLRSNDTKPSSKPPLRECFDQYDLVIGSFQSALDEVIKDKEYETANYDVLIAADDAIHCEESLASAGVKDASITKRNEFVKHFSNIGFVLTADLLDD